MVVSREQRGVRMQQQQQEEEEGEGDEQEQEHDDGSPCPLPRVHLCDIGVFEGAPSGAYLRAVQALSASLTTHNAAFLHLPSHDAALLRCALQASRLFFRSNPNPNPNPNPTPSARPTLPHSYSYSYSYSYTYRPGRALEDSDSSPPCMPDIFRCMGNAARTALSAIARHLRLRTDVFNHLLDDAPLPPNDVSSSLLVAAYSPSPPSLPNAKPAVPAPNPASNPEIEKGLLTLISSDAPGLQVCDPNGRWYLADSGLGPGDLLLLTGKALSQATAGLRPPTSYRPSPHHFLGANSAGRTSLAFRLMPQGNAILDCSPIAAAGHIIPQSYVPISVSQFMDDLSAEEVIGSRSYHAYVAGNIMNKEQSLRSVLSDSLSGAFLEDAMLVSCGHSFGGLMLRRVKETSRCTLCNINIETSSMIPNFALRAAATAVKHEDDRRLFHNAVLRKRRKEISDQMDSLRRTNKENGDFTNDDGPPRGVQYPFSVNEKVIIKGNKRTPEKFVGKEAVITSQCLNGWYLLKIIGTGENVRLQYRSLGKMLNSQDIEDQSQPIQNSSS